MIQILDGLSRVKKWKAYVKGQSMEWTDKEIDSGMLANK